MRAAIPVAAALLSFGAGCADDCEVICGKLQFCELLPDLSLRECVDRCGERARQLEDAEDLCADCLEQASCGVIAGQACAQPCAPVLSREVPDEGGGGSAGG